jgi:signal transduction histidine kinase
MDTLRLLVIDDDPKAYTLLRNMLSVFETSHYVIDWANSYAQGLALLKENKHDVCLLDYRLGHENGVELLKNALSEDPNVAIILLTAYGDYNLDVTVMELGGMDYLDKRQMTPTLLERSIRYAHARKRLEIKLKRLYQEKTELEQLKTEMIQIASHDIKNPVMSILVNLHLLRMSNTGRDWSAVDQQRLEQIEQSANRINEIVGSILSLERIAKLQEEGLQATDLVQIVKQICSEHLPKFETKQQQVEIYIVEERLIADCEPVQLAEAVANLILNAHNYTPDKGRIAISLKRCDQHAVFRITDNGYGVRKEDHERIFLPFFRSKLPENVEEGTGLGLHLVKNIVNRHNGTIIFESTEGIGSTFGFRLPLTESIETSDDTEALS